MPAVIDQHTIEIRLQWLALDRTRLIEKQPDASDEEMARIQIELYKLEGREAENRDYMHILNQDPGWGDLITIDGRKVPKMPKFESEEEMDARLGNWPSAKGHDEQFVKRAREARAREDAQEDAYFMDGIGPIAEQERLEDDLPEVREVLPEDDVSV